MSRMVNVADLAETIDREQLVAEVYRAPLDRVINALEGGTRVLLECDKELVISIINELSRGLMQGPSGRVLRVADHRRDGGEGPIAATGREVARIIDLLTEEHDPSDVVVAIPHLDCLVGGSAQSGLDLTTRTLMVRLAELGCGGLLGMIDPAVPVPDAVRERFEVHVKFAAVTLPVLHRCITQAEARCIGLDQIDLLSLYPHLSGYHLFRLRRVLSGLVHRGFGHDCPDAVRAYLVEQRMERPGSARIPTRRLDCVAGYEATKAQIRTHFLEPVRAALTGQGPALRRHMMFDGPPGTGKTMMGEAIAGELGLPFFLMKGPEVLGSLVGQTERNLRTIFQNAIEARPSIIYGDELASLAARRGGDSQSQADSWHATRHGDSFTDQLLSLVSALPPDVYFIGSCNYRDRLDRALRDRFTREIRVGSPSRADRRAILQLHAEAYGVELTAEVLDTFVGETSGFVDNDALAMWTGRSLEGLMSAASQLPAVDVATARQLVAERRVSPRSNVCFDEIVGSEVAKSELLDIVELVRALHKASPEERRRMVALIPTGILLEGMPGTGKTRLAEAFGTALHTEAAVLVKSASDFVFGLVGESEAAFANTVSVLRDATVGVLILDEVDALFGNRGVRGGNSVVSGLLSAFSGFGEDGRGLIVVGTTNIPDSLSAAAKRPGRFSKQIVVGPPAGTERAAIFALHAQRLGVGPVTPGVRALVTQRTGYAAPRSAQAWTGAHLREVAEVLARRDVLDADFCFDSTTVRDAIARVSGKQRRKMSAEERRVVATHEASHAVISLARPDVPPALEVSVDTDFGDAAGYTRHAVEGHGTVMRRAQVLGLLDVLMAGAIGEEVMLGDVSTGAQHDYERATQLAYQAVCQWGMDPEFGRFRVRHPAIDGPSALGCQPAMQQRADDRVMKMLQAAERRAKKDIQKFKPALQELVDRLMSEGTVQLDPTLLSKCLL